MITQEYIKLDPALCGYKGLLVRIPESYDFEVCDVCGKRRKCDWYEPVDPWMLTGMDVCRSCARIHVVKAVCPRCHHEMSKTLIKNHYVCLDCKIQMEVEE